MCAPPFRYNEIYTGLWASQAKNLVRQINDLRRPLGANLPTIDEAGAYSPQSAQLGRPDELKARMDAVGDVNWSDIARPAFYSALATLEQRRNPDVNTTVERLRASKAESLKRDELEGQTHGREWAAQHADYDELRRLAELTDPVINAGPLEALIRAIDPQDELDLGDIKNHCFGDSNVNVSAAYVTAFIAGAVGLISSEALASPPAL